VPAGLLSFSASKSGYRSTNQIDVLIQQDQRLDMVLQKGDDTTPPLFRVSGSVALAILDGGNPSSLQGSRVSVWQVDGDFQASTSTDAQGRYGIDYIPAGTYQAGAAREGYLSRILDPFELSSNQSYNFFLEMDPAYDWGPGSRQGLDGCGCSSWNHSIGFWFVLVFSWVLLSRKQPDGLKTPKQKCHPLRK
jgi:hypothetical protein